MAISPIARRTGGLAVGVSHLVSESAGERVEIRSRCAELGTKSFRLAHQVWAGDRLVAEAVSVLVGYDYARNATVPITDDVKRRLTV